MTAAEPRMVPRMVWGRRNFQKAWVKATTFSETEGSGVCKKKGLWFRTYGSLGYNDCEDLNKRFVVGWLVCVYVGI